MRARQLGPQESQLPNSSRLLTSYAIHSAHPKSQDHWFKRALLSSHACLAYLGDGFACWHLLQVSKTLSAHMSSTHDQPSTKNPGSLLVLGSATVFAAHGLLHTQLASMGHLSSELQSSQGSRKHKLAAYQV